MNNSPVNSALKKAVAALDPILCQQARLSRDVRFDGLFFTAVKTTGIFCRPICSAIAPKEENVTYYPSAGAALAAGFRPCLRCRPETAPQSAAWVGIEAVAAKILRHIEHGFLVDHSIPELAQNVGISERYLRQLCQRYAGASPSQIELARKSLFAKQLLFDSNLSISDIAFAAGYNSVRRFNEHWQQQFGKAPSTMKVSSRMKVSSKMSDSGLRAKHSDMKHEHKHKNSDADILLRIPVIKGFDAQSIFAFLSSRIISGSEALVISEDDERLEKSEYRRVLSLDDQLILLSVRYDKKANGLLVNCGAESLSFLPRILKIVKQVFDVEANAAAILAHLKSSAEFHPQIIEREQQGVNDLRLPAAFDPFEAAMRAIVGQQVSVKAACTLLTRITQRCGKPVVENSWGLQQALPNAEGILANNLDGLGLTQARINSLKAMALLCSEEPEIFSQDYDRESRREKLLAMKGIGPWTVSYLEMRAFGQPDAFPAGDLGVRIALEKQGIRPSEKQVREISKPWAPWRAYATVLLWQRLV